MNGRVPCRAASAVALAPPSTFDGRERFAAYVAHELRTPMATQRALLELALADREAGVANWRATGEDVLRACAQQERLLGACLALARSEYGPRRCEPTDLATITAGTLRAQDLSGLESVVALASAPMRGDPDLLERLVANLVSNAVHHNRVGGRVEIATHTEIGHAALRVANTGPLIPSAALPRLFQPFQRLDSDGSTSPDGVGLGLVIVQTIVAAHGGLLTARARPAGGLEIDVRFPAVACSNTAMSIPGARGSDPVTSTS